MSFLQKHAQLGISIGLLLALVGCRMIYTSSLHFAFLYWNIFLALIPLYLSHKAVRQARPAAALAMALLWLLFFPNAAYLITDIIHLKRSLHLMYWLDMVILYLAGIQGVLISTYSLREMERWYERLLPRGISQLVTLALLLLCGYGIYLGRIERWNSWDVVAQPADLLKAVFHHSRHPFRNREVWMMSGVIGLGLWMLYQLFARAVIKYSEGL